MGLLNRQLFENSKFTEYKRNHLDTPIYIHTYPIVRLFKWFLFGENQKIEQLQLLYIKTPIVDVNVQFLKKQVNKLIIWPTALPHPTACAVVCLEIKKCICIYDCHRI